MTRASPAYDPCRTLAYETAWQRPKVTLPRVPGAEEGVTYTTVPFAQRRTLEGEHMVRRMLKRRAG